MAVSACSAIRFYPSDVNGLQSKQDLIGFPSIIWNNLWNVCIHYGYYDLKFLGLFFTVDF